MLKSILRKATALDPRFLPYAMVKTNSDCPPAYELPWNDISVRTRTGQQVTIAGTRSSILDEMGDILQSKERELIENTVIEGKSFKLCCIVMTSAPLEVRSNDNEGDSYMDHYGLTPSGFQDMLRTMRPGDNDQELIQNVSASERLLQQAAAELDRYIVEVLGLHKPPPGKPVMINLRTNPFQFWDVRKLIYPTLYEMAMRYVNQHYHELCDSNVTSRYLTIAPTSVEVERVFSVAGQTDTFLRSRLSTEHLDTLIFLKHSLKNLGDDAIVDSFTQEYERELHARGAVTQAGPAGAASDGDVVQQNDVEDGDDNDDNVDSDDRLSKRRNVDAEV